MDLSSGLNAKQFFRFTGPPEHWLTAIKDMTWGLKLERRDQWEKIQTGDVFFIHSTGAQASAFSNAASGIIGMGIVGFNFSMKENPLWYEEFKNQQNLWPLLIPLTEIYLFSDMPDPATWGPLTPGNEAEMSRLIDQLLANRIPISEIKGFPQMGSFSSVTFDVAQQILFKNKPLYLLSGHSTRGQVMEKERSDLVEIKDAAESLRSAASLRFVDKINERIITKPYSLVARDNDILARAEASHFSITAQLLDLFRSKGYSTMVNKHVDLFAHDGKRSFLFEVKSTENKNFRVQARKGIVQLYEYDYFEIDKYRKQENLKFEEQYKILVPSRVPKDNSYINFINSLDLGVATVEDRALKPVGQDLGFSRL